MTRMFAVFILLSASPLAACGKRGALSLPERAEAHHAAGFSAFEPALER